MEASEVLIFRSYSGWEEPALTTPFGFMSLRNLIVLGCFGMLTGLLYWWVVPDNLDVKRDWMSVCVALSPLGVGLLLSSVKPPFGTADSVLLALISLVAQRRPSASVTPKKHRKKTNRKKSLVLGFPRKVTAARSTEKIQEIACSDLDELKSIRVTLHAGDGSLLATKLVRCYLDDDLIDTLRTSAEGALVLHVRPEREGGRTLSIRDGSGKVLLRRQLQFVRKNN